MKTYKGILDIYSDQGVDPEAHIYADNPSGKVNPYDRMVMFDKKKDLFITIFDKNDKIIYEGTWTFSRKNTSLNRMSSPMEIEAKSWAKMCHQKLRVILEDRTKNLNPKDAIIKSFLDTDLYKLTMMQFAFHYEGRKYSTYALTIRSEENLCYLKETLEKQLKHLKLLRFNDEEIKYLSTLEVNGIKIFKEDFLNYLKYFNLGSVRFEIGKNKNGNLDLRFYGSWDVAILLEVPLLAMISELHFKDKYSLDDGRKKLKEKIELIKKSGMSLNIVDMGTRRRLSHDWQKEVVKTLADSKVISSTSNVLFAKNLGLTPIGTMAHEFFQAYQVLGISIETSQKEALYAWKKEYGSILNVALTDIFGTDVFLHDCDRDLTEKYLGYRHDSGDPIGWGYRMLAHFHELGIDARTKTFVFSDSLNFKKAIEIQKEFEGKVNIVFGIGTFLTNDFDGHKALSIVIKLVEMNGKPTIKVSDEPSKITCESEFLKEYALNWIKKVRKYPVTKVATDLLIKNEKKEILLLKRGNKDEAGFEEWALPGGYLDYFETAKEGVLRELKEELGVNLDESQIKLELVKDDFNRDPRGKTISLVFFANVNANNLKINVNKEEVKEYEWVKDYKSKKMAFDHSDIIKEVEND